MVQSPESLKKVRDEFKLMADKQTMEFSLLCENKCDILDKVVSLETVSNMDYLNWTISEVLRIFPASYGTSFFILNKEA